MGGKILTIFKINHLISSKKNELEAPDSQMRKVPTFLKTFLNLRGLSVHKIFCE